MFCKKFDFRSAAADSSDVTAVKPQMLYSPKRGFGFVTEKNFEEQPMLQIAEVNSGFEPAPWYRGSDLTRMGQDSLGCFTEQGDWGKQNRQIPLRFKCEIPSAGNYRVTVTICPERPMADVRIFVGRRQLADCLTKCRPGERQICQAVVNVNEIIPRGQEEPMPGRTVDVTVTADFACISELQIEEIKCPVLYIGGDSTVTDQPAEYPYAPEMSYAGWGQMLPWFLEARIAVANHSHSGLTTESFRQEGHYAIVKKYAKAGDYLFLQFGHNDQKLEHLKAREGYRHNLAIYIQECRESGIHPLLVTPVARNSWKGSDNSYNDLLAEYAGACLELGAELGVPVLDLHGRSRDFILEKGREEAKRYFFPSDFTHHNDFGACLMASFICSEIARTCASHAKQAYRELAGYVKAQAKDLGSPRQVAPLAKPEGYRQLSAAEALLAGLERPEDVLLRAEAMDMVIKSAGFFQTNVYNDYFDDVVGHEWYAGTVECALQNGILVPRACDGKRCRPRDPVTLEEFLVFAMNGYLSRRAALPQSPCPYDGACSEWAKGHVRMAYQLGALNADGSERLDEGLSRRHGAEILKRIGIL